MASIERMPGEQPDDSRPKFLIHTDDANYEPRFVIAKLGNPPREIRRSSCVQLSPLRWLLTMELAEA